MPTIDLFTPRIPSADFHPVFAMLLQDEFAPERAVLQEWAHDFQDRDGKFVQELQSTFESGLWELYLHASFRELGLKLDMSFSSPDFVVTGPRELIIEATVAAPPLGGKPAYNYDVSDIPTDFNKFNSDATLRICNSFDSKIKRYRNYYSQLPQSVDKPYVIAIGAFDRPLAHMAASRPILAALYGLYHDEEETMLQRASAVISYNVAAATKTDTKDIPVGLFCTDQYRDVSAVIYSALATWGKIRALADNPSARTVYTTYHPNSKRLAATVKTTLKKDYREQLLDGLYILHNPFAENPIKTGTLHHPRVAQCRVAEDGELQIEAPEDFLLLRSLISVRTAG